MIHKQKKTGNVKCLDPDVTHNEDFKRVITNIFKKLKETVLKEVKEIMMTASHQTENINKEKLFNKRNIQILELKVIITSIKNVL